MGQKFPNVIADPLIALECPLRPTAPDSLGELGIMLLEEFRQGSLLDTDTEIGVFQLGGGNITIRLHQFLIVAIYFHTDFIHYKVDFLRFDTLARSTPRLYVPQPQGNIHLATEPFNLSVHRKAAHQRQVAIPILAAFLHVK